MNKAIYVWLDVHKDTIAVAVADEGRRGECRFFGTISNKADSVLRLTKQLTAAAGTPSFCYEAGTCGYGLHRHLTKLGFECAVVAPARWQRPLMGKSSEYLADVVEVLSGGNIHRTNIRS